MNEEFAAFCVMVLCFAGLILVQEYDICKLKERIDNLERKEKKK